MGVIPEGFSSETAGKYLKLPQGTHKIRVLGGAMEGSYLWQDAKKIGEDKNKPLRRRKARDFTNEERANATTHENSKGELVLDEPKQFLALPVWNYQFDCVQVWEVTQKGIMSDLQRYDSDPDWGDLTGYDLKIIREGEGFDTKYSTTAVPAKKVEKAILDAFALTPVNLEALYEGGDPFTS